VIIWLDSKGQQHSRPAEFQVGKNVKQNFKVASQVLEIAAILAVPGKARGNKR
jgi:hypothetical protein